MNPESTASFNNISTRNNSEPLLYQCPNCLQLMTSYLEYVGHLRGNCDTSSSLIDDPSRPFKCRRCPRSYQNKGSLARHLRHECGIQRNQFQCKTCNKVYQNKGTLARHHKYECGREPQFFCPYCPMRSKRKCNISVHIQNKHQQDTKV